MGIEKKGLPGSLRTLLYSLLGLRRKKQRSVQRDNNGGENRGMNGGGSDKTIKSKTK